MTITQSSGLTRRNISYVQSKQQTSEDNALVSSWSAQYMSSQAIPPLGNGTQTALGSATVDDFPKEDGTKPYPTDMFSKPYMPFWTLLLSFHLLFVAFSSTQNMLTTVMGTGATFYLGLVYLFLMLSSFFSALWLTTVFFGNSHLAMFCGSLPYSIFLFTCLFREHFSMAVFACVLGVAGPPLWVGWGSFLVALSRYIAELDFIKDTQNRLHQRYQSTPDTKEDNQIKIQALTDQIMTPVGRVNQLLLTTEQLQRLQVSTSQITAMLTSLGSAMMMMNLVVGGLIAYFLLAANTKTDPVTGVVNVNSTPLIALYLIISLVSNCIYFFGLSTVPAALYAPTETPVIVAQEDVEQIVDEAIGGYLQENEENGTGEDGENATAPTESNLFFASRVEPSSATASAPTDAYIFNSSYADSEHPHSHQHPYAPTDVPVHNSNSNGNDFHSIGAQQGHKHSNRGRFSPHNTPNAGSTTPTFHPHSHPHHQPYHLQPVGSFLLNRNNSKYLSTITGSTSSLAGVIRGNSYIRVKPNQSPHYGAGAHHEGHFSGAGTGTTPQIGPYDPKHINNIDGLDLDNLPQLPALDDIQMPDGTVIQGSKGVSTTINQNTQNGQTCQNSKMDKMDKNDQNATKSNSCDALPPKPKPDNPLISALNGVHFMWLMIQQRVIYWSLVTWFQQSLPQVVMYSLFSAHIVKVNIGAANTSLYMGTIALFGLAASLISSRLMKTFQHARFLAFVGTVSYSIMFCVLLKIRSMDLTPYSAQSWALILFIAAWTGFSDASTQSGVAASLGMVVEGNALVRSGGFGLNTLFKSCGQIFAFLSTRWISFKAQLIIVLVVLVISAVVQVYNYMTHTPIDTVALLEKNEQFTKWSKGLFGSEREKKAQKDNAIEATLDEL